jgi:hypothetical protein
MRRSIAHVRGLLVVGVTVLSLGVCAPAFARAQAPSPRDCATAWNRGASPGVGTEGGASGVWTIRSGRLVLGVTCKPNARLDRSGTLHLL